MTNPSKRGQGAGCFTVWVILLITLALIGAAVVIWGGETARVSGWKPGGLALPFVRRFPI